MAKRTPWPECSRDCWSPVRPEQLAGRFGLHTPRDAWWADPTATRTYGFRIERPEGELQVERESLRPEEARAFALGLLKQHPTCTRVWVSGQSNPEDTIVDICMVAPARAGEPDAKGD